MLSASLTASLATALDAAPFSASLFAIAGCGSSAAATPASRAEPDLTVLRAAIAAKKRMITLYNAVRAAHPTLSTRLDPLLSDSAAHLAELQRRLIEPGGTADRRAGSLHRVPASPPQVPSDSGAALAALGSAERAAAAVHVRQLRTAAPSLAQLLASIAACEVTHVAALGRHGLAP